MNRKVKNKSSADRLIPQRKKINVDLSNYFLLSCIENKNDDKGTKEEWLKRKYREQLCNKIYGITNIDRHCVLNFCENNDKSFFDVLPDQLWPVKSRKKPLIGKPVTILDIPTINFLTKSIIDWSANGDLVCIHEREVYIWGLNLHNVLRLTNTNGRVLGCIKLNNDGTLLAIALKLGRIGIFNLEKLKMNAEKCCFCVSSCYCSITSMVWTKKDKLITACSQGFISIWNKCLNRYDQVEAHTKAIVSIQLSCKENYLATHTYKNVLHIWSTKKCLKLLRIVHTGGIINGLSWHPFKEQTLVFARTTEDRLENTFAGTMFVLNLNEHYPSKWKKLEAGSYVETLSFCPFTGELVVSYSHKRGRELECELAVHSDFDTKVDSIRYHKIKVCSLVWNEKTKQLATAGVDENLCIWDFLGKPYDKVDRKSNDIQSKLIPFRKI